MWINFEQAPSYPPIWQDADSYSGFEDPLWGPVPTWLFISKVLEKKEENGVLNKKWPPLSTNPILIH